MIRFLKSSLLLGALALLALAPASARELMLSHMGPSDGLPDSTVYDVFQDSQGFIWIATDNGLARYDGSKVVTYLHVRGKPNTLGADYVWQIVEGPKHNLWLATWGGGLSRWDRKTNTFTNFQHIPGDKSSISSNDVRTVAVAPNGDIVAGTENAGLDILNPKTGKFTSFEHSARNPHSLSANHVYALMFDARGNLWIGTQRGLDELLKGTRQFKRFSRVIKNKWNIQAQAVQSLLEGRNGDIWAGTLQGGLALLDSGGRLIKVFSHDSGRKSSVLSNTIVTLLRAKNGNIWVGTSAGLDFFNRTTGKFIAYKGGSTAGKSLNRTYIRTLMQDSSGLLWIGTDNLGVFRWDPKNLQFGAHKPVWLKHKIVTAFAQISKKYLWVGTTEGLYRYNLISERADTFYQVTGSHLLKKNEPIMSLQADRQGLWIGTYNQGLVHMRPNGKLFQLSKKTDSSKGLSASGVLSMLAVRKGIFWLGTYGGGLNILNAKTDQVEQISYKKPSIRGAMSSGFISAMAVAKNGDIWAGTFAGGLDLLAPNGRVIAVYKNIKGNAKTLPSDVISSIARGSKGRLWIGTSEGLCLLEGSAEKPKHVEFKTYSQATGLSSNEIISIIPDKNNVLWLSSSDGLMRFDAKNGKVRTYHVENGLSGENFQFGAFLKLRNKSIVFGGNSGFSLFNPNKIDVKSISPRVVLSNISVLGAPYKQTRAPWELHKLDLGYRDNIVSLSFGVLDFTAPGHNRLAYKVSGITNKWVDLGTQKKIILTNLQAGKHVLEVRGEDSDSVWSKPLKLVIYKNPAPWFSPAAYLVYVLLAFIALVYFMRRQRALREKQAYEKAQLEAQVQARTKELQVANEELQRVAKVKGDFLDRMSHELRTPINGVVGMTELLSRTALAEEQRKLVKTIRSSGEVLLQLVNDLLDFSKVKAGKVRLESIPLNLKHLLEECTNLFVTAAKEKGLTIRTAVSENATAMLQGKTLLGDPLRVRQILLNLISNAVKFTDTGSIEVSVNVAMESADKATVELAVKDSGIGMQAHTLGSIFDPFTQAEESTSRRFGGSGLGLAICRELATLMGGKITVASTPGKGSTFTVLLSLAVSEALVPEKASVPEGLESLGAKVLIVEDEPVNAAVAEGYLKLLGCVSVWADNGQEALKRASSESFDVILMDINMPGEDGFAVTQKLREFDSNTPVIALTAHDENLVQQRCLAAGMNGVLGKPYTLEACATAIKRWATRRSILEVNPDKMTQNCLSAPPLGTSALTSGDEGLVALCAIDEPSVASFRRLRAGQKHALYHSLMVIYCKETPLLMCELGRYLKDGVLPAAAAVCHKLKSSTASLGALLFAQEIKALEALCLEGNSQAALSLYLKLQQLHPLLLAAIKAVDERTAV